MNEAEFKEHLKALAHGHHHPEEHDWDAKPAAVKKPAGARNSNAKPHSKRRSKSGSGAH